MLGIGVAALFGTIVGASGPARACRTPVFRYAMYNWPGAPYWVFAVYHGEPSGADRAVEQAIRRAATDRGAPANLRFESAGAERSDEFDKLPEQVQAAYRAWRETLEASAPPTGAVHLVFTAWGAHLWTGRLTEDTIPAMVGSPARREIGRLFDEGNAAVLLLLTSGNAEADREAEAVVDSLLAETARGKFVAEVPLDLYQELMPPRGSVPAAGGATSGAPPGMNRAAPPGGNSAESAGGAEAVVREALRIAKVVVRRDDPAERWLVDSLLALEPDLAELAGEPMVFVVYGRGRAMPPCVGRGITLEYLADAVGFLAAACSCQVKDENPGMDLLMAWNWDVTAENWAAGDPELSLAWGEPPTQEGQPRGQAGETEPEALAASAPLTGTGESEALTGSAGPETPQANAGLRIIGLGIALAAALVLGAGFVFLRRRGDVP